MVLRANGRLSDQLYLAGTITKNGAPRLIPLHPDLALALRQLHTGCGEPETGPAIRSERGQHITAGAALGMRGCSSHSGRRTFITRSARLLARSGGSLRDVQELAGHRHLTTTERYIKGDRVAQRKLVRLV